MIFGIGVDICKTSRFADWIGNEKIISRFFNEKEILQNPSEKLLLEHYSSRFAVKEAFGKALGTGLRGFSLTDIYVIKNVEGKPELKVTGNANKILKEKCGDCKIHLTISHEAEYAIAYIIIEC